MPPAVHLQSLDNQALASEWLATGNWCGGVCDVGGVSMEDVSRSTNDQEDSKRDSGVPGGGRGRKDEVGRSGVYPMSGPHPAGNVGMKQQASWGQGERGAAGFEDHGRSELSWEGGQLLGGLNTEPSGEPESKPAEIQGDQDIPHAQWLSFLDSFSRQHLGWLATIELVSAAGRLIVVEERRFQGISVDRGDEPGSAYVQMGETLRERVTHIVRTPTNIRFKQSSSGEHQGLEIVSADGTTTVVRFRSMMRPDMLDGIAI